MDVCIMWDAFVAAVTKALAAKGVGSDTFNAYALNKRLCPPEVRRHYYETLKVMIRAQTFPEEFHDWRCVLAMKKGEDPRVIHRRRDLWLVPHAQKLVARMVGREYIATTNATVPGEKLGRGVRMEEVAGRGAPPSQPPARSTPSPAAPDLEPSASATAAAASTSVDRPSRSTQPTAPAQGK